MGIIIAGASLSKQHTDLLICHKSRICHSQVDHKANSQDSYCQCGYISMNTKVISYISDVYTISAVYAWPLPEATSTTVVIEFVLPVGNLLSGVSCHVYFNSSHLNSR